MKVVGLQLPTTNNMERLPLPFSADLLWRYPLPFAPPPPSPLFDGKSQLPSSIPPEPRMWSRDDVSVFLKWCEREYDLPNFDMDMFQMNGKALCLLTKTDLSERCSGAGDVLYNVLQILVRDATLLGRCLPSSPITPTSRGPYPLSPHSHPPTPTWNTIGSSDSAFQHTAIAHFGPGNSVTLSPAPSVDSQAGSPQRGEGGVAATYVQAVYGGVGSSGSNNSDSDEEKNSSPPAYTNQPPREEKYTPLSSPAPHTPNYRSNVAREFFPNDMPEPTNGRLLWDFLQQLLNDPSQRYTNFIAWKNRDTGVFKIVDPAGLAKLWGIQKNHLSMNYDKMSRALRYYYRVNILRKVQGERHCYQFLRNPTELKNIKNISLLKQEMSPNRIPAPSMVNQAMPVKTETEGEEERELMRKAQEACYQFLPTELKNMKNISLRKQEMSPNRIPAPSMANQSMPVQTDNEGEERVSERHSDEDLPTDLSMTASSASDGSRKRPYSDNRPPPLTLSEKHRISVLVGENIQKIQRDRDPYSALNLKSENAE